MRAPVAEGACQAGVRAEEATLADQAGVRPPAAAPPQAGVRLPRLEEVLAPRGVREPELEKSCTPGVRDGGGFELKPPGGPRREVAKRV